MNRKGHKGLRKDRREMLCVLCAEFSLRSLRLKKYKDEYFN